MFLDISLLSLQLVSPSLALPTARVSFLTLPTADVCFFTLPTADVSCLTLPTAGVPIGGADRHAARDMASEAKTAQR